MNPYLGSLRDLEKSEKGDHWPSTKLTKPAPAREDIAPTNIDDGYVSFVSGRGIAFLENSVCLCDHCGFAGRGCDPLRPYDWPGHPNGVWLHQRCEGPWNDGKGD